MDSSFLLLAINTLANLQNLEINKDKVYQDNICKKLDEIIILLKNIKGGE